jgi:hypothetical protein
MTPFTYFDAHGEHVGTISEQDQYTAKLVYDADNVLIGAIAFSENMWQGVAANDVPVRSGTMQGAAAQCALVTEERQAA